MVQNNTDMNVVSSCLDATFTQKRTWVNKFPVDRIARIATVFEKYPCFSNVTMIVGEIARVLKSAVTVDSARVSLAEEIDTFLYYRIHKLVILRPLPPKSNTDTKVKHLMNYLLQLFINESSKKKKTKTGHIVLEKTIKNLYLYTTDDGDEAIVMCGEKIILHSFSFSDAVIGLIEIHYVMEIEYDPHVMIAYTIFHYILFKDESSTDT